MDGMRKYVAEFLGTFTLVFIATAVATSTGFPPETWGQSAMLGIAFAFGGTLTVLVLVIGPVSGCHLNPAVTIPMALSGRLKKSDAIPYIVAQCLGATVASLVLLVLMSGIPGYELATHGLGANGNPREMGMIAMLGWEIVLTGLFLFVIFAATRGDGAPGFHAIAIGGYLFVAVLVGAQFGDASLNPARSLGPALFVRGSALVELWVFVVGPIIGGLLGWQAYRYIYND